jgi:hypothetical protein
MCSRSTQLQRASTLHTRKTRPSLAQVQTVVSDLSSPVQMRENDTVPELTEGGWNGEFVFSEYADVICRGKCLELGSHRAPAKIRLARLVVVVGLVLVVRRKIIMHRYLGRSSLPINKSGTRAVYR